MRLLPLCVLAGLAGMVGCQAQMIGGGAFVAEAPTPVIRADVNIQISFFGIPLAGAQDVVFVLDHSGSMSGVAAGFAGEDVGMSQTGAILTGLGAQIVNSKTHSMKTKMEAAKEELAHTLAMLPDGTRFMIIFFDDELAAFAPQMVTLDPSTRQAAIQFVHGIKPGGSTAAVPALRLAYQAGAARVVLLSDGLANNGGSGGDLLAEARNQIRQGVRFDTVGLGIDQDSPLLNSLAVESGGLAVKR
jgi:hypothetical protein